MSSSLNIVIMMIYTHTFSAQHPQYFVSKYGIDDAFCGNASNPCGTLYQASILSEQSLKTKIEFYIIDGQNEAEINNHQLSNGTNHYNPCLPLPFAREEQIIISFNPSTIQFFHDWYPTQICYGIRNKYLFDNAMAGFTINNLIVSDYLISEDTNDDNHGIIRTGYFSPGLICTNCTFVNIAFNVSALLYTPRGAILNHNRFINIATSSHLISAERVFYSKRITIQHTQFSNIFGMESMLHFTKSKSSKLRIIDCDFSNISTKHSIITTDFTNLDVTLTDITMDIQSGAIYHSRHYFPSAIEINNINITLSEQASLNADPLFYFDSVDLTAINGMTLLYSLNIADSCSFEEQYQSTHLGNASVRAFVCRNPAAAIYNHGMIDIEDLTIDLNIVRPNAVLKIPTAYTAYAFEDGPESSFIINEGIMSIVKVNVKHTICRRLIFNEHTLSIYDLSVAANHDPNQLHSTNIVVHTGRQSLLFIQNCRFFGSRVQIQTIYGGRIEIVDSVFEMSVIAVDVEFAEYFAMRNCEIYNNGKYYGPLFKEEHITSQAIKIYESENIVFDNNTMTGYDPNGLLFLYLSTNITFIDNYFSINMDQMCYNVTNPMFHESILSLWLNTDLSIINNHFDVNAIDASIPWIQYTYGYGVNCLSGNVFTNYAIDATGTYITSCFKPQLVQCTTSNFVECSSEIFYFNMNESVVGAKGYFMVNNHVENGVIVSVSYANMVLDDTVIILQNTSESNTHPVMISLNHANISFIDSFIDSAIDLSYNSAICQIKNNDRLTGNVQYISKLVIHCGSDSKWGASNDLSHVQMVQHSIGYKIDFFPKSSSYYPGQLLQFGYQITDRFGNRITNNVTFAADIIIHIESDVFTTIVSIKPNGKCPICDNGLMISAISIYDNIGDIFTMTIYLDQDTIAAQYKNISLQIIGCPSGYGPDSNNFTCTLCASGSYNLLPNNVENCKICDAAQNVECVGGDIKILYNYWMGMNDGTIVSALCPPNYCCQQDTGCNYLDKTHLCALNRNHSTYLCGSCNDGYSESINSAECVECNKSVHYRYLLQQFIFSVLISVFLIAISVEKQLKHQHPKENVDINQNPRAYMILMLKITILKNIFYYEQSLSQLISTSTSQIMMRSFVEKFNLSLMSIVDSKERQCFVDGLNAKWKILSDLTIPVMVILWTMMLCIVSKFVCKRSLVINFSKVFTIMCLIIIGKILDVLFHMMSCQKVGDIHYHYYFGNEICYQFSWWASSIALMLIVISSSAIVIKLAIMNASHRQNVRHTLSRFIYRYEPQYYYWEFVIFIRRILIALFSVSEQDATITFIFFAFLLLFIWLQHECNPFIVNEANKMEFILLVCVLLVAVLQFAIFIDVHWIGMVISALIILPFPLLTYFIFVACKKQCIAKQFDNMDDHLGNTDDEVMDTEMMNTHIVYTESSHE
eukprot:195303_1